MVYTELRLLYNERNEWCQRKHTIPSCKSHSCSHITQYDDMFQSALPHITLNNSTKTFPLNYCSPHLPPYESDTEAYDHTSQNWSFRY